jgi:hypothetical protein
MKTYDATGPAPESPLYCLCSQTLRADGSMSTKGPENDGSDGRNLVTGSREEVEALAAAWEDSYQSDACLYIYTAEPMTWIGRRWDGAQMYRAPSFKVVD